ncbi:N-terminal acetyltransferase B complex subunit Mdm20p [[Candida] jaroonii]|uniref:N-terminal acetyltransferase B complex subunit Mdm20p n=1 Tax=[Candida] jaroonii TaxID=467808 RepID=A0ACA9Y120_9ASCO|nr:N-terminal acetyltransferase B complex subunit Mdm20p [[Candida] jaroonii]
MEDTQIVEAIDSRNYQFAQSLISLKTSKYPQSSYYQALQVYLYHHQHNPTTNDKAIKLLNQYPTDLRTTSLLSKIFLERGLNKEADAVYENLVKKFPNNCQPNLLQWFENSLQINNIRSLQKSTFHLSKNGDNKYKFWAGLGYHLLCQTIEDEKQIKLFTTLGSKILPKPETTHELYVSSLLNDNDTTIELIEEFMTTKPLDLDIKLVYLDLISGEKLFSYTEKLLFDENFNDFNTWKKYISSSLEIGKKRTEIEEKILDYQSTRKNAKRNTSLALVELYSSGDEGDFTKYCRIYYEKFNKKLCCYDDLKPYNVKLTLSSVGDEISVENLNHSINNYKFGEGDAWMIYEKYLSLTKDKVKTDFYPANELVIADIMSHIETPKEILEGIIKLRRITIHDPLDFRVQLNLIKLYSYFNMQDLMYSSYETIKVRMLQIDSLGHFYSDNLSYLNPSKASLNHLVANFRFYLTCEQDISDNLVKAFEKGIYNKIPNFIKFNNRVIKSFEYYNTVIQIWQIIRFCNDKSFIGYFQSTIKSIKIDEIIDNRDSSMSEIKPSQTIEKLKIEYAKEHFLLQPNEHNFKKFNKLLEGSKLSTFDTWLFKLYLNLFRMKTKPQDTSSKNYLIKNLKIAKIQWSDPLTKDFMYQWTSMIYFCKTAESFDEEISKISKRLKTELYSSEWKDQQKISFNELKKEIKQVMDTDFVKDTLDILSDSLNKASYMNKK